jgi:acyl-coenzyme A synthetase/AMP-(fatty) acid ligase
MFEIERQITYQELQAWQNHIASMLLPWAGRSVVISLPVGPEAFAAYLGAKDVVVGIPMAPKEQIQVLETMLHWDCPAALVGFKPSSDIASINIMPGVWLISIETASPGVQEPGLCLLTTGTTGAAKSIKIPQSKFEAHWNMSVDNGYRADSSDTLFLGLPLWTCMGFTTAWIAYQARAKTIFKAYRVVRGQLVDAFNTCDVVACGIGLLRVSRIQPVQGKRLVVTGPGLSHERKLELAEQLKVPILYQYGATEVTTISQQDITNWYRPGNGVPKTEHRITANGTMEVWCRREGSWWDSQDLVRIEEDGQLSVIGRTIFSSIRTLAGSINLNNVKSDLLKKGIVDDAEFILVPNDNEYRIGFVYRGSQNKNNLKKLLKMYNHDVNFVDWMVHEEKIRRNEIGKIDRAYYLNLHN